MKNEKTSKRVATLAGELLAALRRIKKETPVNEFTVIHIGGLPLCEFGVLESVIASALTQAPDIETREALPPGRLSRSVRALKKVPVQFAEKKRRRG